MKKKKVKIITFVFLMIAVFIGYICYSLFMPVNLPSWALNLPSNIKNARTEINENIQVAYPIGSPVNNLIKELQSYNFGHSWYLIDNHHSATKSYSKFPCEISIDVKWEVSKDNKIKSIFADRRTACL